VAKVFFGAADLDVAPGALREHHGAACHQSRSSSSSWGESIT
jgi:hypothetical protein